MKRNLLVAIVAAAFFTGFSNNFFAADRGQQSVLSEKTIDDAMRQLRQFIQDVDLRNMVSMYSETFDGTQYAEQARTEISKIIEPLAASKVWYLLGSIAVIYTSVDGRGGQDQRDYQRICDAIRDGNRAQAPAAEEALQQHQAVQALGNQQLYVVDFNADEEDEQQPYDNRPAEVQDPVAAPKPQSFWQRNSGTITAVVSVAAAVVGWLWWKKRR